MRVVNRRVVNSRVNDTFLFIFVWVVIRCLALAGISAI